MPFFPLFVSLEGVPCLVVGGGPVALRKARQLLRFGGRVTAVAPDFCPGWQTLSPATLYRRPFAESDLSGCRLAVAASDDPALNAHIAALCRQAHIPVNSATDKAHCTFLFPALIHREPLTIGISTGGASPAAARCLRERIEALLPPAAPDSDPLAEILEWMSALRPVLLAGCSDPARRAALFRLLFDTAVQQGRPLTCDETAALTGLSIQL